MKLKQGEHVHKQGARINSLNRFNKCYTFVIQINIEVHFTVTSGHYIRSNLCFRISEGKLSCFLNL